MSDAEENSHSDASYVTINVDPIPQPVKRIKLEVNIDIDNDMSIPCRLCAKTFANPMAIRNHVRILHMGEDVDVEDWLQDLPPVVDQIIKPPIIKQEPIEPESRVQARANALVAGMKPYDMTNLISGNVQYVILKSDEFGTSLVPVKRKKDKEPTKREREALEREARAQEAERNRTDPVGGPFECLQPSSSGAGVCHQIFFSCCEYSAHYRDDHTRRRKSQRCQVCEKLMSTPDGQEAEFPYMCQVCGAGFSAHTALATHTAEAHEKLKPFQCTQCLKRFTQAGGLAQHLRAHRGDRPFGCAFCSKAFTQKSGLDQHLRIHTKVKPYRCVICQKSFCQSVHLKQHMRTHTNVTPFQCAVCARRFKQSSHLNYHLRHHATSGEEEVVVEEERGYMLSDNGDETWTVVVQGADVE